MDQQQIARKMMEYNKSLFGSTFKTISTIQDQSEKMLTAFMEKAAWLSDDGKKVIADWLSTYRKGREDIKTAADDKYEKVASYFMKNETAGSARMQK